MASAIDPSKPTTGNPTTQSVRDNFEAAKTEIEDLQEAEAARAITVLFTATPGAEPDYVTSAQIGGVQSATRYLIRTIHGTSGTVTFHPAGNAEFSTSPPSVIEVGILIVRIFRYDDSGFNVQLRTINLNAGTMTNVLEKISKLEKVKL